MKHRRFFVWAGALIFLCFAVLFLGCPTEGEEGEEDKNYGVGDPKTLEVTVSADTTKYYSLTTGQAVTDSGDIASQAWDIAFARSGSVGGLIYTNSGATATALSSGGQGGVWYTNKTDFDAVEKSEQVTASGEYAGLDVDTTKYIDTDGNSTADEGTPYVLNVMTYLGYDGSGDGSSASSPYQAKQLPNGPPTGYLPYNYDKHQFYKMLNMMQSQYEVTNEVYIIKHGNGTDYSKIQVTDYGSSTATGTVFEVTYRNFQ
jgi:hypothetical protein